MTEVRATFRTKSKSSTTDAQLKQWLSDSFDDLKDKDISGRMVVGEGDAWIELEGGKADLEQFRQNLSNNNLFEELRHYGVTEINARDLDHLWGYFEADTPLSSVK